jgi:hypothetical protein
MSELFFSAPAATNWLTLILVIVTTLYCVFTYQILQRNREIVTQMKAQYESFIEPSIAVTIEIKHSIVVCLRIRNVGKSRAKNLRLALDRDFYQYGGAAEERNLRTFPTFQTTIPSFGPNDEIFFMLSQGFNLGKKHAERVITPYEFSIGVRYEFGGREIGEQHAINLHPYMKSMQDRSELVEEAEKIRKELEKANGMARNFGRTTRLEANHISA